MVAEGVASLLRQHPGLVVARTFPTVAAALAEAEALRLADLALVDFHLGESDAGEAVRELRRRHPALPCIWLTGAVTDSSLWSIEEQHFEAFVHKDDPSECLLEAIQAVRNGLTFQSPTAKRLLGELRRADLSVPKILSEREQEVLALVGRGLDNAEIGATLGLSTSTAQTHRRNIMGKLGLRTSVALQAYAQQSGFVERTVRRSA